MSYHIYRMEGFVLGSKNAGEANKHFFIYTKDLGLVYATAQGIRFIKSKLRHVLQDYSLCNISLVRGKEIWRVTNVAEKYRPLQKESLIIFAKVCLILKRFLHGEERNDTLWNSLVSGFLMLSQDNLSQNDLRSIEILLVLQSLSALGYISLPKDIEKLAKDAISQELILFLKGKERLVLQDINRALKESQL